MYNVDVDKLNIICRSINRSGQLELWNPLMSTLKQFQESSYKMPTPENLSKDLYIQRNVDLNALDDGEMSLLQDNAFLVANQVLMAMQQITEIEEGDVFNNFLEALAENKGQQLFELINEAFELVVDLNVKNGASPELIALMSDSFANLYQAINNGKKLIYRPESNDTALISFMYLVNKSVPSINGYKNAIINQKDKITQSPRTYVAASSPMAMDDMKAVGKLGAESAKFAYKQTTPYNPMAPVVQHVNNMVGKDSIGVMAVALKAYSGVTIAYKSILDNLRNPNYDTNLGNILSSAINSDFKLKGTTYNLAADTDLTKFLDPNLVTVDFLRLIPKNVIDLLIKLTNKNGVDFLALKDSKKVELIKDILFKDKYRGDSAEFKSELLSAATDFHTLQLIFRI